MNWLNVLSIPHEVSHSLDCKEVDAVQITLTGNPKEDAALLHEAEKRHLAVPVELDAQIEAEIRKADLDFSGLKNGRDGPAGEEGGITIGEIRI